jgi:transposase-like protein
MASKHGKRYSPKIKFQVVLDALQSDKSDAEIARAYDVNPVTVSRWKREFKENGPEVFGGDEEVKEYEQRISQLEGRVGRRRWRSRC